MKFKKFFTAILLLTLSSSFAETETNALKTDKDKLSYAIGMMTAKTFKSQKFDINSAMFTKGFLDVMNDNHLLISESQAQAILKQFEDDQQQQQKSAEAEDAKRNLQIGQEFLEKNKRKPGVVTLKSGLQYEILTKGTGNSPGPKDSVTVNYEGKTINGNVFDSSYARGKPATFVVGQVIKGWQEALQLMKPGATWNLYIPADLAYGSYNVPNIGPNQVLIFKVELISVKKNP